LVEHISLEIHIYFQVKGPFIARGNIFEHRKTLFISVWILTLIFIDTFPTLSRVVPLSAGFHPE
jgi:hypothetical protein